MNPGIYSTKMEWLQASRESDGTTGAQKKTYASGGYLWSFLGGQQGAIEQTDQFGAVRLVVTAEARIRQYPDVKPIDRLRDTEWDETYQVVGVRRGDNEIIVDLELIEGI